MTDGAPSYWWNVIRRTEQHRTAWALTLGGLDRALSLPAYLSTPPSGADTLLSGLVADAGPAAAPDTWLAGTSAYVGVRFVHPDTPGDAIVAAGGLLAIYRSARPTTLYTHPDEWRCDAGRGIERVVLALIDQHALDPLPIAARPVLQGRGTRRAWTSRRRPYPGRYYRPDRGE